MQTIKLLDGRTLAYAEYGDPAGTPVFFFHGIPGSRIFRPPDDVTARIGVRLICADRPGYGCSTFMPNRTILDWPLDVAQLADKLRISRFSVAGHSGGGPYVAAAAYALPERVSAAAVISGIGPLNGLDATKGMQQTNKMGFRVGRWLPWPLWRVLFCLFFRRMRDHPELMFPDPSDQGSPDSLPDHDLLRRTDILELSRASVREAFRQGTVGHAWEGRLVSRFWGFKLEEIRVPTFVWHGQKDDLTPMGMGQCVADSIPNSRLHFFPDEGHLLIFRHWAEILEEIKNQQAM